MRTPFGSRATRVAALASASAIVLSGCGFSPYELPLPGGADLGDKPFTVTAEFKDVLDLVPQSGVRVNDLPVGKVTKIQLDGWNAKVTLKINGDVELPDDAIATIRQTSLLGEKFVSLAAPATGGTGRLGNGDTIPLAQSGRNPEIEEVFSAASLLFNGGGLERTNTIVKELNATLGGNEPEIKELLGNTEQFLGQLDDNKQVLLTSLEKVNRLAIATNEQRDAITGALDDLPEALDVVNDQRDDLVTLLKALDKLGDTATDVIKQSKDDTVADLKALTPTLRNLAKASDDFAYDFKALLTFPFTDGFVGDTVAKAGGRCENPVGNSSNTGWCKGDYANLNIRLDVDAAQLDGVLQLLGIDLPGLSLDDLLNGGTATAQDDSATAEVDQLVQDLNNVPGLGSLLGGGSSDESSSGSSSDTGSGSTEKKGGLLCGLFGSCRTAPASSSAGAGLTALLTDPAQAGGAS